ncbi:CPBP family intramembrane glutamic endopeptidase [Paludisphaera rhizosphaerae]|uniref:CPBP family intramembrane glutamic endopeptidase n=1 Tax=Paludisphaera rhizosphaerae TaxID=2711216 RepID=UPI0013EAA83C|nr:CPBP family intramembrane glutamic endopeptidase [Paludisphaera rhizosphaerae]
MSDSGSFPDPEIDAPGHDAIMTLAVFAEGGLAPASLLLGWLLGHAPLKRFGWDFHAGATGALLGVPLAFLLVASLRWRFAPFIWLRRLFDDEFVPLLANSTWDDLALIAVATGVGQEMMFRGVFQQTLMDLCGDAWGVVLASFLFAVLHPVSISYALLTLVVGLYLGTVYAVSGNLLASITCNIAYVFIFMSCLLRPGDPNRPRTNPIIAIEDDRSIDDPNAR